MLSTLISRVTPEVIKGSKNVKFRPCPISLDTAR
jgi:hypothetical protein